ncbi:cysteine synthase, putative [Fagus crenata]
MLVFMLSQLVQVVLHSVQDGVMLNMNKALQINEQIVISMPWCIVKRALESGKLARGGIVTEGSARTTAISLAIVPIKKTGGGLDAFVAAAGTGIMAGISREKNLNLKCFLIDPPSSGLFNKNLFDTMTEGIGINRLTQNFTMEKLDGAFRGTDLKLMDFAEISTIVTILCDSGMRHLSKFHNAEYLSQYRLTPKATRLEILVIR